MLKFIGRAFLIIMTHDVDGSHHLGHKASLYSFLFEIPLGEASNIIRVMK